MKLSSSGKSQKFSTPITKFDTQSSSFDSTMSMEPSTKGPAVTWDELRKEARSLENQVEIKLVALSKFGTSLGQTKPSRSLYAEKSEDREPLLGSEGDDKAKLNELTAELETLLNNLTKTNESLSHLASGQGQSSSVLHTLQRHKEILHEYRQEMTRTKANLITTLERRDLLTSVRRDISDFRDGSSRSRMDILLKESEHVRNSERLIDEQISIAIESRESLMNQRQAFKAIQAKLNDLSSRFPLINNLVQKINLRKKRDSIILGSVIGLCLTFLLWYALA